MEKIILFHGTPNEIVIPTHGKGEKNMTMDKGFILQKTLNLQKSGLFAGQTKQMATFISTNLILTD